MAVLSHDCNQMHLSMLSPRVGGKGYLWEIDTENLSLGRDFDMPAILEHQENLEMSYPQSWFSHGRIIT